MAPVSSIVATYTDTSIFNERIVRHDRLDFPSRYHLARAARLFDSEDIDSLTVNLEDGTVWSISHGRGHNCTRIDPDGTCHSMREYGAHMMYVITGKLIPPRKLII